MFGLENLLKVIDPTPVAIDHQACLRARHKRSHCRACTDICPDNALSYEDGRLQVDPGLCSRCSLCAGACPTVAMTVRGIDEKVALEATEIRCTKAGADGVRLPCLGWFTADQLIEMGLRHGSVTLMSGDCAACAWSRGGEMADAAMATASVVLDGLGRAGAIRVVRISADTPPAQRVVSRRELFALWGTEGAQVAKQLMPERDVNPAKLPVKVPVRRSRWMKRVDPATVAPEAIMPPGPWKNRLVGDACNGCSICVGFCPTGALTKATEGEEWVLNHQAAACVACGTCVALCPLKTVGEEPLSLKAMVEGAPRELARRTVLRCGKCRKEFKGQPGDTACPQCRAVFGLVV